MILAVLALVLLAVVFGGRRLGQALGTLGRRPAQVWRPTAGLAALGVLTLALVLAMREDWLPAGALSGLAVALALGARYRRRRAQATPAGRMSPQEARAILGLDPGAGPDAVQAAYRRLIRMAHPDTGGTRGLAAQLNLARDVLLGR